MKRVEQCYFKALKTGFVENKGQSGPLSADTKPKANVSCQLNFRPFVSCQLKYWPFVSCQLSVSYLESTPGRNTKSVTEE